MSVTPHKTGVSRFAVLGTDRRALFQIEALEQLPNFECAGDFQNAAPMDDINALIVSDVCNDSMLSVRRAIDIGLHVLIIPPVRLSAAQIADLVEQRIKKNGQLLVWRPLRNDADSRAARRVARAVEIGTLRSIRYTLHEMAAEFLPAISRSSGSEVCRPVWLDVIDDFLEPRLDLLLGLTNAPVRRVFATCSRSTPDFSAIITTEVLTKVDRLKGTAGPTGCLVVIEFGDGLIAQVDLDLAATARLAPGWTLQGTRGGYAGGRQFCSADDGELFDVPVETVPVDPCAELLSALRGESELTSVDEWANTGVVAVRVAKLLEAIRESAASGQPVDLDSGGAT